MKFSGYYYVDFRKIGAKVLSQNEQLIVNCERDPKRAVAYHIAEGHCKQEFDIAKEDIPKFELPDDAEFIGYEKKDGVECAHWNFFPEYQGRKYPIPIDVRIVVY